MEHGPLPTFKAIRVRPYRPSSSRGAAACLTRTPPAVERCQALTPLVSYPGSVFSNHFAGGRAAGKLSPTCRELFNPVHAFCFQSLAEV